MSAKSSRRAARQIAEGWKPIETAPSYVAILVFVPGSAGYGGYYGTRGVYAAINGEFGWQSIGWGTRSVFRPGDVPTHWRPIPAPPEQE